MTTADWAQISNYAVASATTVVALAFLAHVAEWGLALRVQARVAVPAGSAPDEARGEDAPSRPDMLSSIGSSLTVLAAVLLVLAVVSRGIAAERAPWGNMYEFGVAGAAIALVVQAVAAKSFGISWLGGLATGFALVLLGLAMSTYVPAGPLVPALDSYWLVIHVAAVMISGSFFLLASGATVLFLVRSRADGRGQVGPVLARLPSAAAMDQVAYRFIAVGFPVWTFGALIAGPIWAHYAWGRYWGWDPKETWAFITWVVYAGYLHARATAGWRGHRAAAIALVGFATFVFSYYGVNLWVSGLHSYAR